jgi:zeaxanthin glucosyltransferase
MAHFGFITLAVPGHMYPMSTLAAHIRDRGHRVTFFTVPDGEAFFAKAGLECVVGGRERFPIGYTKAVTEKLGLLKGMAGLKYTLQELCAQIDASCAEFPALVRGAGVEAMVLDQAEQSGSTVAEHLKLPYVHVANALMLNTETSVPPFNSGWGNESGPLARVRNLAAHAFLSKMIQPICDRLNAQRKIWGLPPFADALNARFGTGPQISQEPPSFEFPRKKLPKNFHFVGPLHSCSSRGEKPFPWERLNGKPVIYASMGTLQNGMEWTYRAIAEGCAGLDAQLVMSLGGNMMPEQFADLPGDPVVVQFAPQLEVLKRASVCITHAGLNTALESLARGVPMVAIPVTNDQPGVAARVKWTGSGEIVPLKKLKAPSLRAAVLTVMSNPRYRENARRLQAEIGGLNSLERASEIVESVLQGPGTRFVLSHP